MKVIQGKVIPAMATINSLGQTSMKSATAYKLFRLKKAMETIIEFQVDQEQKIIDELGGEITQNGMVHFANQENGVKFAERRDELANMECDLDIEKQDIFMSEIPEISIAGIESLEEFINWIE